MISFSSRLNSFVTPPSARFRAISSSVALLAETIALAAAALVPAFKVSALSPLEAPLTPVLASQLRSRYCSAPSVSSATNGTVSGRMASGFLTRTMPPISLLSRSSMFDAPSNTCRRGLLTSAVLSRMPRKTTVAESCSPNSTSAIDCPKNVCGIGSAQKLIKGMSSQGSKLSIL